MKIQLITNVPVHPIHKMTKGRVLDVVREGSRGAVWVQGEGEEVMLHSHEYEYVSDDDETTED